MHTSQHSRQAIPVGLHLGLIILVMAAAPAMAQNNAPAEWTVMVYSASDNNLEAPQMENLRQIVAAGSSKAVNILVLADRSKQSAEEDGYTAEGVANLPGWSGCKLLYVAKGKLTELENWGVVNTGDPATLKRFVTIGTKRYPAKKYALVFADHGASWPGVCGDEDPTADQLTTAELADTLAATKAAYGGRIELLGFDACLMGNLETAYALAPYCRFMVASEELVPGCGWSYEPVLTALVNKPQMNGAELGTAIANAFRSFFTQAQDPADRDEGKGVTLSVTDLDQVEAIAEAAHGLAEQCQALLRDGGRKAWIGLARARAGAEEYGRQASGGGEPGAAGAREENPGAAVHDLADLARLIKQQLPDAAAAADAVIQAVQAAVVHQVHGEARPRAHGLSIFFPPSREKLTEDGEIAYEDTAFAQDSAWLELMTDYTDLAAGDTTRPELAPVATNNDELAQNATIEVTSNVDGDDVDEVYFVLAQTEGDEQLILGQMPTEIGDNGELAEEWDGQWFTIQAGDKEIICPVTDLEEVDEATNGYFIEVPAQVRREGSNKWTDVTMYFDVDLEGDEVTGDFVYAFADTRFGPRQVELEEGDSIRPVFLFIDAEGEEHRVASDDDEDILQIDGPDDLLVATAEVDPGNYLVGFVAVDLSGDQTEDFVEVQIE